MNLGNYCTNQNVLGDRKFNIIFLLCCFLLALANLKIHAKKLSYRFYIVPLPNRGRDRGGTVVQVLCYKSEGRWFHPSWCNLEFFFHIKFFRLHYGPGVYSASNRNEYQGYFLGVKAAGA